MPIRRLDVLGKFVFAHETDVSDLGNVDAASGDVGGKEDFDLTPYSSRVEVQLMPPFIPIVLIVQSYSYPDTIATMYPPKLKPGDKLRIIAPARSLGLVGPESRQIANERFKALGLELSFGKHIEEIDEFSSSSIESRIEDLHDAFRDESVKGVLTVLGGYNSNQLFNYIDWDLIKRNPKVLCGYSDITALANAIYAKTGLVTYSGPHYSTFGMKLRFDYTLDHFKKCLMSDAPFELLPSREWSDDAWYANQDQRKFISNPGYHVIQEGIAEGTIVGANICTFNLLHGTSFMPSLKDTILFIEEDELSGTDTAVMFDRDLQSILHQSGAEGIRGVVIGRFQRNSRISDVDLEKIIHSKRELRGKPVVSSVDFGHTDPYITFPIGGRLNMEAGTTARMTVLEH